MMNMTVSQAGHRFYVMAVRTGGEEKYISHVTPRLTEHAGRIIWPRRNMKIRKKGIDVETTVSLFPGYLFWKAERVEEDVYSILKKGAGFIMFLKSNSDITPLDNRDAALLMRLLSGGDLLGKSTVRFDEHNRIRVIDGPLKGLEGDILKVDRRKRRARVVLNLNGKALNADLGFNLMDEA